MLLTLSEAVKASSNHRNGFVHSFLLKQYDIDDDDFRIKIINPKRGPDGGTQVNEALLAEGEKKSFDLLLLVQDEFRALCQKLGIRPQVSL